MASLIQTAIAEAINITVAMVVDKTELSAGLPVKVGEVGSVAGVPVYVYLSTNASLT